MKFTPGPAIAAASGSIGGTVFSRNRYGAYTRNRAIPIKSTTIYALAAKARLGGISAEWQDITAAEKLAWNSWALNNPVTDTLGQSQILTGHAAFVSLNARIDFVGGAHIDKPPVVVAPSALLTVTPTIDIGAGAIQLAFTPTPCAAGIGVFWKAAVVDSVGITYVTNILRSIEVSSAAQASPYTIETPLLARLGDLQVGQYVHIWACKMHIASGLIGPWKRTTTIVTTT